jgi:uncharacterized protein (TIGR01777 family)
MKVVIAGGRGFLGSALGRALLHDRHAVSVLTRGASQLPPPVRAIRWKPDGSAGSWASEIDGADAVINLSGESIAGRRWTDEQKRQILESRRLATRSLVAALHDSSHPPAVFVSGSAVGFYGPRGAELITEEDAPGNDFLANVCVQWEQEAMQAAQRTTRVALVRTGLVLERRGGALPRMLPPFWFGIGGPVGSGDQYWPWIHINDWIGLVQWMLTTPHASGPFNAASPAPATNADFAHALGRALHRPAVMPTPGFVLKIVLGEMADALLLSGQRVVPRRAERLGFEFKYADLDKALRDIFAT